MNTIRAALIAALEALETAKQHMAKDKWDALFLEGNIAQLTAAIEEMDKAEPVADSGNLIYRLRGLNTEHPPFGAAHEAADLLIAQQAEIERLDQVNRYNLQKCEELAEEMAADLARVTESCKHWQRLYEDRANR